jgi:hypothetical protein
MLVSNSPTYPDLKVLFDYGFALVPIPYGEKGPCTEDWNLRERCISDPCNLHLLAGRNLGLAHAYCTPTPTCAIDIDNYWHAKSWLASHGINLDELLYAADAVVIWSGKKGSLKLLYRLPLGTNPLETKKIVGPDGKSTIEFRCATKEGKTVQDVLPPSRHPDGHDYTWVGEGDPRHIPDIPSKLLSLWLTLIANNSRVALRTQGSIPVHNLRQESPRERAILLNLLTYISADCPYEIWRNVVWAILSTGWLSAEDIAQQWSESAPHRYSEDVFWLVASSYIPNHTSPITFGTIFHHARLGGFNG